ncbi:MAG: hypothetical protein ACRDZ8_07020 [Acidimicrobiales bacterium]
MTADREVYWKPKSCRISPERVVELPSFRELRPDRVEEIDEWLLGHLTEWWIAGLVDEPSPEVLQRFEGRPPSLYCQHFSVAPGSKVGGYVDWEQDAVNLRCPSGHGMDHLVTVSTFEHEAGEQWFRWLPIEHQAAIRADSAVQAALANPLGLEDMRADGFHFFVCRQCPDPEVILEYQSN